jgi:hypothetical protein
MIERARERHKGRKFMWWVCDQNLKILQGLKTQIIVLSSS